MREQLERFAADEKALRRTYGVPGSPQRLDRLERFYREWLAALASGAARDEAASQEDWVDAMLLRLTVVTRLHDLAREGEEQAEAGPLVPFSATV
jgi:hypothetical protein